MVPYGRTNKNVTFNYTMSCPSQGQNLQEKKYQNKYSFTIHKPLLSSGIK